MGDRTTSGAEGDADGVGELLDAGLQGGARGLVEGDVLGGGPHRRERAAPAEQQPRGRWPGPGGPLTARKKKSALR
jgi:hypothetical protein